MTSNQENSIFERLLRHEGSWGVVERMKKSRTYQRYYIHYPYDDKEAPLSLNGGDYYDEIASDAPRRIEAEVDFDISINPLTERQQLIARLIALGLKPRDIARLTGEPTTGSIRYCKWYLKRKLAACNL